LNLNYNHDSISRIYDQFTNAISLYQTVKTKEYLINRIKAQSTALEIGCGNGGLAISCAGKCAYVLGLDVSKNMIENAKKLVVKRHIDGIEFIQKDLYSFNSKKKFDYIILAYFLNIFPDEKTVEKVISKAKSFLKPGGVILIADELEPSNTILSMIVRALRVPVFNFFYLTTGLKYHKIHDLEKVLENAGIEIIEKKRFLFQYCSVLIGKVHHGNKK
jgi:ubiquinone/menaquinone biosynthesis C-methylase UbiE